MQRLFLVPGCSSRSMMLLFQWYRVLLHILLWRCRLGLELGLARVMSRGA